VIQQLVNVEAGFEYDDLEGGAKVRVEHRYDPGRDPLQKTARSAPCAGSLGDDTPFPARGALARSWGGCTRLVTVGGWRRGSEGVWGLVCGVCCPTFTPFSDDRKEVSPNSPITCKSFQPFRVACLLLASM